MEESLTPGQINSILSEAASEMRLYDIEITVANLNTYVVANYDGACTLEEIEAWLALQA